MLLRSMKFASHNYQYVSTEFGEKVHLQLLRTRAKGGNIRQSNFHKMRFVSALSSLSWKDIEVVTQGGGREGPRWLMASLTQFCIW